MVVADVPAVVNKLAAISYYRLSGYWHPLLQRDATGQVGEDFEIGTTFQDAIQLYEFDQQLRTLVLSSLEQVEVAVRPQFTYVLAHRYGPFGYASAANFHPGFRHSEWLAQLEEEVTRSKDVFLTPEKLAEFKTR